MKSHPKKKDESCKSRRLYGWHPVYEYLRAAPQLVQEVYVLPSLRGTKIDSLAQQKKIQVRYESSEFLTRFTEGGVHQGVAARLHPFPYASLSEILSQNADLLLILDGVVDPRNFGALLRTAEAAGVGGIITTTAHSAPLSALVEKAAAGSTAHLRLCKVGNLARTLSLVKEYGYWLIGLAPEASRSLYETTVGNKVALLVGGEEKGLRLLTRQSCDYLVSIPMRGQVRSLNASVAGAVALYELVRRSILSLGESALRAQKG